MIRTRKRDDDSQYSDGTSLAFDASSMSAAGSRSSLTFASSKRQQPRRKRRRKTLSDALQSITLDQDVPEQILKVKEYPFSKSVSFTPTANDKNPLNWSYRNDLNSQQRLDRQVQMGQGRQVATGVDGDVYFDDDDNSQLTTSSEENEVRRIMEDEDEEEDEEDDDEDSHLKKESSMTEMEKAQRKVMFELVFGKNHREARNGSARRTGTGAATPPPLRIDPRGAHVMSPPPPPMGSASASKMTLKPIPVSGNSQGKPKTAASEDDSSNDRYKDPADRKIEELLRQSLKNLKQGSHPLALPKLDNGNDDDAFVTTPWKTQDDMAVDPEIYSRVRASASMELNLSSLHMSAIGNKANDQLPNPPTFSAAPMNSTIHYNVPTPFTRQRSNSLPGGLESFGMAETADMDTDD